MTKARSRNWVMLATALLPGCGSGSHSTRMSARCVNLSGFYSIGQCRQHERIPLTDVRLPDETALAGVTGLRVEQTACSEVRIKPVGRPNIVLRPNDDSMVRWLDRVLTGQTGQKSSAVIGGFCKTSREWHLAQSNQSTSGLTYTDSHNEHGMALLLIPYSERSEVSCELNRVTTPH